MKLSDTRVKILKSLRKNARIGFSELGREHNIPVTTVFDNYDFLAKEGYIQKHSPLLDFKKMGFAYRSFVFLKANDKDAMYNFLQNNSSVNSVYRINDYDFLVDGIFENMKGFYSFLESLDHCGVEKLEHHDVIEPIKIEDFYF